MPNVDFVWVRDQMQAARVKVGTGTAVLKLLETWESLKLSDNQAKETIQYFSIFAQGHAVVEDDPNEIWVDARPGDIVIGDQVRVKADAFDGDTGKLHNGRRGKVVGVRYGDIIFKSTDDKLPVVDGAHYSPHQLEKRVQ